MGLCWYLPTFHGDVRLEALLPSRSRMLLERLSPTEKKAVTALLEKAAAKGWADIDPKIALTLPSIDFEAPIEHVQKVLVKALRPNRKTVSVIKIRDGKIEEITESSFDVQAEQAAKAEQEGAKPAATTVALPERGCPSPAFAAAEQKATRVLRTFLTPEQTADWNRYNAFVVTGDETGHKYAITSRTANALLRERRRTLYDLDTRTPYCVHDWTVPAPEECLALALFLQMPGYERYLRGIPDEDAM